MIIINFELFNQNVYNLCKSSKMVPKTNLKEMCVGEIVHSTGLTQFENNNFLYILIFSNKNLLV